MDDKDCLQHPSQDEVAAASTFELAIRLREFEIAQLAQRNNFFMIFQGVLLAGVVQSIGSIPVVSFMACLAGLFTSVLQTGMAAGAKYWQERWEYGAERAERILLQQLESNETRQLLIRALAPLSSSSKLRMRARFFRLDRRAKYLRKWRRYSPINRIIVAKPSVSRIPIYTGISFSFLWLILLFCTLDGNFLYIPDFIVGFPSDA